MKLAKPTSPLSCKVRIVARRKLKAQLVFEFVIAVVVFFGIILYVLNYLNFTFSGYRGDFFSEDRESKAAQIAELLVLNKGNWSGETPVVAGLAEEWPVLNSSKISWLESYCSDNDRYEILVNGLGVHPRNRVRILVRNETGVLANCTMGQPYGNTVEVKRFGLSEGGKVLTVSVYVWEQARRAFTD